MATAEDAKLILHLYELRREEVMRKARNFIIMEFFPASADDIRATLGDPQKSAYYRQATSYWDLACSLVNHGSINAELFYDASGEYLAVWAKIGDYVPELRETVFGPHYLKNLERLIQNQPGSADRIAGFKARFKKMAEARAAKPVE